MSISRKAEKRQKRKEKKKQKLELELQKQNVKFNVIWLLKNENISTKPNLGAFLKQYVKDITVFNTKKILLYPTFCYDFSKVFVKFIDGHELIWDKNHEPLQFFFYNEVDEVELKTDHLNAIANFFSLLEQFEFIR